MVVRPGPRRQSSSPRTRRCKVCRKRKSLKDFYVKNDLAQPRPDHRCKDCQNRLRYGWQRSQFRRDPQAAAKRAARDAVKFAVKNGRLKKPSKCHDCRKPFPPIKLEGHHDQGYENRLKVIWLCHGCHSAQHRASRLAVAL